MNANSARPRIVILQIAAIALLFAAMTALFSLQSVTAQEPSPQQIPAATPQPTLEATPEPPQRERREVQERSKTRPDAPGSLAAVRASSTTAMKPALDVTWTKPADNGYTITKYNLYYGTDKSNMTKLSPDPGADATSVRLTGLNAGTTYHVRVWRSRGITGSTVRQATGRTPRPRPTPRQQRLPPTSPCKTLNGSTR